MKIKMTKQQFENLLSMCEGKLPQSNSARATQLAYALRAAMMVAKSKKAEGTLGVLRHDRSES